MGFPMMAQRWLLALCSALLLLASLSLSCVRAEDNGSETAAEVAGGEAGAEAEVAVKNMTAIKLELFEAVRTGNIALMEELMTREQFTADERDPVHAWTLLFAACENNQTEVVKLLIEKGAHANLKDKDGYVPIHVAAQSGLAPIIEQLLAAGANVNYRGKGDYSALHFASLRGHLDAVKVLLQANATVDALCEDHWKARRTPLVNAAFYGHLDVVRELLKAGANPSHKCLDHYTPLHAAAEGGFPDIIALLLDKGVSINPRREKGVTPFMYSALKGRIDAVQLFLDHGADVTELADNGWGVLHASAHTGNPAVVERVLAYGAQVHIAAADKDGMTPLHLAARRNHTDVLSVLLTVDGAGAALEMKNKEGKTPAVIAENFPESLKLFTDFVEAEEKKKSAHPEL